MRSKSAHRPVFDKYKRYGTIAPANTPGELLNLRPVALMSLTADDWVLTLDGSASYDSDGTVVTWSWLVTLDGSVVIGIGFGAAIEVVDLDEILDPPLPGEYEVRLQVFDNLGLNSTTIVDTIDVAGP